MERRERHKRLKRYQQEQNLPLDYRGRRWFVMGVLAIAAAAIVVQAVGRQVFEKDFLQHEGNRRHLSTVKMPAYRGLIKDRRGEVLAVSTPVYSVWLNPREISRDLEDLKPLATALEMKLDELNAFLDRYASRAFIFVKRRASPDVADQIAALSREQGMNTFGLQREYRRYYPAGEVFGHVLGFTNIDDQGQEGLELVYNKVLQGIPGKKHVVRDGKRRVVDDIEQIAAPVDGKDLQLSLDSRLQHIAYRSLKTAIMQHNAKAGSAVVVDVKTGEILAMVNQPGFNPNGSRSNKNGRLRNRAVTDAYEPGSTMKPFVVAAGLDYGVLNPGEVIDTSPGWYYIGRAQVKDHHNLGKINLETLLQKSSNVGASRISQRIEPSDLFAFLSRLGFGVHTGLNFPGESSGVMRDYNRWAEIDRATISYGYSLSATTLQLAKAYAALGNDGVVNDLTLFKTDKPQNPQKVMSANAARAVVDMLKSVTEKGGTAPLAAVEGYEVAGKTGTSRKLTAGGYDEKIYRALFAGVAPADNPRLAMAVIVDEPRNEKFYGGDVAGPVFAEVMSAGLRLYNIPPKLPEGVQIVAVEGKP